MSPESAPAVEVVKVNYAVDLRLVAECIDAPVATLQELNPSLLRMTTPKDADFDLTLPAGTGERFRAAIAAIPLEMRTQWRYHKVQSGETLSQVALRYHTSTRSIAQVNGLQEDAVLEKDAKLIIPVTAVRRAASEGVVVHLLPASRDAHRTQGRNRTLGGRRLRCPGRDGT